MKRSWPVAIPFLLPLGFFACSVDANVGTIPADAAPTNGDATLETAAPDAIGGDASTPDAADVTAPVDAGCGVTFAQQGSWIDLLVVQDTPPFGQGGTIVPGTYALTALRAYLGSAPGTAEVRETLAVAGSPSVGTIATLSESRNTSGGYTSYPPTGTTATYMADSPTMSFFTNPTCGTPAVASGNYTATGSTLSIVVDAIERVYQLVP
jgi:hypothetical protein